MLFGESAHADTQTQTQTQTHSQTDRRATSHTVVHTHQLSRAHAAANACTHTHGTDSKQHACGMEYKSRFVMKIKTRQQACDTAVAQLGTLNVK